MISEPKPVEIDVTGLTDRERGIVALARLNELLGTKEIRIARTLGRLTITFNWRSSENLMGRFGGGWNWELGMQIGGATIIVNLLIFSLRVDWRRK